MQVLSVLKKTVLKFVLPYELIPEDKATFNVPYEDGQIAEVKIERKMKNREDISEIKGDVSLREQLDLDSMDFLDIVMELKKRHKIEVPQEDYMQLATLDSCVEYLAPKFH